MITKLNPDAIKNNSITIDKLADVHSVTWNENSNINNFIKQGRYFISGERKNNEDGLPIGNLTDSNNFNAELLVLEQDIPIDYSKQYFTIQALESGNISFGIPLSASLLKYRKNNEQWIETTDAVQIPVNSNDKIQISCICNAFRNYSLCSSLFHIDIPYIVYGNIMSLLYGDDFKDKTDLTEEGSTFAYLFSLHETLKNAENLILPATTLPDHCYYSMFQSCTSLTTAPELPATTLANDCYSYMFIGCDSLTTAPELPATTLAERCYSFMFYGCNSLNKVTMLATDINYYNDLFSWLHNVAPKGTFVKHPDMISLPTDSESGVPSGWELIDYVSENNVQKNNESENRNHIITQKLTISTSEGNSDTYTRTGIGSTSNDIKWKNWGKLQQFIDLGQIEYAELDKIIDNGMYTGMLYEFGLIGPFTMIVLNDEYFTLNPEFEQNNTIERSVTQILFSTNAFQTYANVYSDFLMKRCGIGDDNIKWEKWIPISENITNISYSELVDLCKNGKLRDNMKYYIYDYRATSKLNNTFVINNNYTIVVEALDGYTLNENALFYNSGELHKKNILEIKYCLGNDTNRFDWADPDNGKGVIYYMKDEYGNEAPYDFKNILYIKDEKEVPTFGENCSNNIIKEYKVNNKFNLPNITFGNNCTDNTLGNNCHNNTFGGGCNRNTFGYSCHNNAFGDYCNRNTLGNTCETNTFEKNCTFNTFGNSCNRNTFESGCTNNTFGEQCLDNTFGSSCYNNTFGDYCTGNTFGGGCNRNTFGYSCHNNAFGDYCTDNTFGKYCNNNTFEHNCIGNAFGNECSNNYINYECNNNTFGNDCKYIRFNYESSNNKIGNKCWYINFRSSNYNTFDDYCGILDSILVRYADPGNYFTRMETRVTTQLDNSNYNHFDKNSKYLIINRSNSNTIKNDKLIDELKNKDTGHTNNIIYDYVGQGIYNGDTALSNALNDYENNYKPNNYLTVNNSKYCLICKSKGSISEKQNKIIGYTLE